MLRNELVPAVSLSLSLAPAVRTPEVPPPPERYLDDVTPPVQIQHVVDASEVFPLAESAVRYSTSPLSCYYCKQSSRFSAERKIAPLLCSQSQPVEIFLKASCTDYLFANNPLWVIQGSGNGATCVKNMYSFRDCRESKLQLVTYRRCPQFECEL